MGSDNLTKAERSALMRRVRQSDTAPELVVRSLLHAEGYRYRLHAKELPGRPDIVFRGRRRAIFVHGCFWHRHRCRPGQNVPKSNTEFWLTKFEANMKRDRKARRQLKTSGWLTLVVWECETHSSCRKKLLVKLRKFMSPE